MFHNNNVEEVREDEMHINGDWWYNYIEHLGKLDLKLIQYLPDFLIISPAKTGSTWLAENMSYHPEIFIAKFPTNQVVPQKELKFFCNFWRFYDINWYLNRFKDAENLKKGESSPSYILLPTKIIKIINSLMPKLKLIFLMRDPIARAWSYAKHSYKYHIANFNEYNEDLNSIPEQIWFDNFTHEALLPYGDYKGILKRWLTYFPKAQFYIGFYESIKNEPQKLLVDIFQHIGVKKDVNWKNFRISETIFSGLKKEISPNIKERLQIIYRRQTEELADFLLSEFNLKVPKEWENTLRASETGRVNFMKSFNQEENKELSLMKALSYEWEAITNTPFLVEEGYRGYNLIFYRNKYYGFSQTLGQLDISNFNELVLANYEKQNKCVIANSLEVVKQRIDKLISFFELELDSEDYYGFNIIQYKGNYYAFCQSLGTLDISNFNEVTLADYKKQGKCVIANSLQEVKQMVISIVKENGLFLSHVNIEFLQESPDYNLFKVGEKFIAVSKTLGEIDLVKPLWERDIEPEILTGSTIDELKNKVITMEKNCKKPSIELILESRSYNLFKTGENYVAIAKILGAIDLNGRIGEYEIKPGMLTGKTLEELKDKVSSMEVKMVKETSSYNLFKYGKKYVGILKALGPVDLQGQIGECEIRPGILTGETLEDLEDKVESMEVEMVEETSGYNLFKYGKKYVGISKALGPFDLQGQIGECEIRPGILTGETLEELEDKVESMEVEMVEESPGYNLFKADKKFVAIDKTLGPVDPAGRIIDYDITPGILLEDNLDVLRDRIRNLEDSKEKVTIKLIEELPGYNIVKTGEKYIAISKALGPIDLMVEHIGEREISPAILLGTDSEELKRRVKELEI